MTKEHLSSHSELHDIKAANPSAKIKPLEPSQIDRLLRGESIATINKRQSIQTGTSTETAEHPLPFILKSGKSSFEPLPMIEVIFDRFSAKSSSSLRKLTGTNIKVSLSSVVGVHFGDYLAGLPKSSLVATLTDEAKEAIGLLSFNSDMIYSIVDVLLGGKRGTAVMRITERPYTNIEKLLLTKAARKIATDLSQSFQSLIPLSFDFDHLENNPKLAVVARDSDPVILSRFKIEMEEREGTFEMMLPYASLGKSKEILSQSFIGENSKTDSKWQEALSEEIALAGLDLTAVLATQTLPLKEVLNWRIGSKLELVASPDSDISLFAETTPMFYGKLGRKGSKIAIQIEAPIAKD